MIDRQSAPARAWQRTIRAHEGWTFRILVLLANVIAAVAAVRLAGEDQAGWAAVAVTLMTVASYAGMFAWSFARAPHWQRDEARRHLVRLLETTVTDFAINRSVMRRQPSSVSVVPPSANYTGMSGGGFVASLPGPKRFLIVAKWIVDGGARAEVVDLRGGMLAHRVTWTDADSGARHDYNVFIDDPGSVSGIEDAGLELVMRQSPS